MQGPYKLQQALIERMHAGSHMRRPSTGEHSGSMQLVGGRPVETWELEDDAEGGEPMHNGITLKDWLRHQPDRNFDPDLVPDSDMADFLGGTVSVSANRAGEHVCCIPCAQCLHSLWGTQPYIGHGMLACLLVVVHASALSACHYHWHCFAANIFPST